MMTQIDAVWNNAWDVWDTKTDTKDAAFAVWLASDAKTKNTAYTAYCDAAADALDAYTAYCDAADAKAKAARR